MNEADRARALGCMGLADAVACSLRSAAVPLPERRSAAHYGLCIAAIDYRPEAGAFEPFAWTAMRREVFLLFRRERARHHAWHPHRFDPADRRPDVCRVDARLDGGLYAASISRLSPRGRAAMGGYAAGLSNGEIARDIGASPQAVETARQRAAAKMRQPGWLETR